MNNEIRMKANNNIRVSVADVIPQIKNFFHNSSSFELLLNNELIEVSLKAIVQRIYVQTLLIPLNCH